MSASYAAAAAAPTRPLGKSVVAAPSRDNPVGSPQPSPNASPDDAKPAPPRHRKKTPSGRGAAASSYYRPASAAPASPVFVLTLRTGPPALEARLSAQRRHWFPPARLRVPAAHATVFHALPSGPAVPAALARAARALPPRVPLRLGPAFRLGGRQGVAVGVVVGGGGCGRDDQEEPGGGGVLARTRRALVQGWLDHEVALSPQDRRTAWRPHYTVLNKEGDPARVEACLEAVAAGAGAAGGEEEGWADGFVLWRYERDGRWTWVREFGFGEGVEEEEAAL